MKLSIVATLYNSAPYLEEFYTRAHAAATSITDDFEIVLVDDGSPDDSLHRAVELAGHEPRLTVVELSRNFGHHRAMMTGLSAAKGEFVFLIDSDLEEEPEWLPPFWNTLIAEGVDVVYGYQEKRKGRLLERLGGALHWQVIKWLSDYPIPDNLVTARLMTRQYVRSLGRHREQKTAIGGLWALAGYRQVGKPVVKGSSGRSSYSLAGRIAMAFDGITSFSQKPLMLVFFLGAVIFAVSFCGALYLIFRRLTGTMLSGWASTVVSVWMLGGLSIASIGILGLYIARIFIETKGRPYSIIRRVHGRQAAEWNHGEREA